MTAKDDAASPFSTRLVVRLALLAALCLVGSVVLTITSASPPATRSGSDSTNTSALGHSAFIALLRDVGLPVTVSRSLTARRTAGASLLLILEPRISKDATIEDLDELVLGATCPVVLVLPKWRAIEFEDRDRWEALVAARIPSREIDVVLRAVDDDLRSSPAGGVDFTVNALGQVPKVQGGLQRVTGPEWTTVVGGPASFFVADHYAFETITIVSDPDPFANHGLHHASNAELALAIVRRARVGDGPILVDETMHGLGVAESFWARLFEFPLVLATVQAAIAAVLFVWAGARRFGAVTPWAPAIPPGKAFLVDHVAGLLESGGHHAATLDRYLVALRDAAAKAGAGGLRSLPRREARARVTEPLAAIDADVRQLAERWPRDARRAQKIAMRLWRWKQEVTDGSRGSTVAR